MAMRTELRGADRFECRIRACFMDYPYCKANENGTQAFLPGDRDAGIKKPPLPAACSEWDYFFFLGAGFFAAFFAVGFFPEGAADFFAGFRFFICETIQELTNEITFVLAGSASFMVSW